MSFSVDQPAWLMLAAVLLAAGVALAIWTRGRSARWRSAGILLPALAAASVAAALAGVALAGPRQVLILLDLSPSTRASPWRNPEWVRTLAEKRLGARTPIAVAGFDGTDTRLLLPDAPPAETARWPAQWNWPAETDPCAGGGVERALAWRLPGEPADSEHLAAARWVITDGLFPAPANAAIAAWTIMPPDVIDVGITDIALRSPDPTNTGTVEIEVQARAVGRSSAGKPLPAALHARVQVSRDNVVVTTVPVEFHAGAATLDVTRWISVRDTLPASPAVPHAYRARIGLTENDGSDPWPENDAAAMAYIPPGEMKTLVIGESEPAYPHTAFVRAEDFVPRQDHLAVEGWQTIILDDLPAKTLAPLLPPLNTAVRDDGTGLLILGSGHAFGPGGYDLPGGGSLLEQSLSPFWSRPHEGRHAHVVFLIDASASMNEAVADPARPGQVLPTRKITFAGNAVAEACDLLSADDRVTVVAFNAGAEVVADGPVSSLSSALPTKLAAIAPQGATAPDTALAAVMGALGGDADTADVMNILVLFTDGEIPAMNVPRWQAALAAARARLVMIAPPVPAGDNSVLRQLAGITGASWSQSPTPLDWSAALQTAIAAHVAGRLQDRPIHWTLNDPTARLSADAASWTRVWKKPEALLLGQGATAEGTFPLVAVAQRGLGQVGAIAITNDRSPAYIDLVTRMARRVAAAPGDRRFTLACTHAPDGTWQIIADGIGNGGFLDGESLAALVTYASPQPIPTTPLPLRQTAPGHYELSLSRDPPAFFTVQRQTPAGPVVVGRAPVAAIETTEWPASVQSTFDPAAAHGVLSAALDDPTRWEIPPTATMSLTMPLWILSVLACLAALWLRR